MDITFILKFNFSLNFLINGHRLKLKYSDTIPQLHEQSHQPKLISKMYSCDRKIMRLATLQTIWQRCAGVHDRAHVALPSHRSERISTPSIYYFNSCDFFLFPKMKNVLKGRRFGTLENIQKNITDVPKTKPVEDFQHCYHKWKQRLYRC